MKPSREMLRGARDRCLGGPVLRGAVHADGLGWGRFKRDDGEKRPEEQGFFKRGGGAGAEDPEDDAVQSYSLLVMNIDKAAVAPEEVRRRAREGGRAGREADDAVRGGFMYQYRMQGAVSASDSFLGPGRYAVVDLSAGPSEFGSMAAGGGAVIAQTLPRSWFDWSTPLGPNSAGRSWRFQAQIIDVVRSAVANVFVPDLAIDQADYSEEVLVALIVLRDHRNFDPLEPGHAFSLDVATIEEQVMLLALPEQPVHFVAGLHNLQEHERVAIAVARASRADTSHTHREGRVQSSYSHYIDSKVLLSELAACSDYLAAGLMAGHPERHNFFPEDKADDKSKRKRGITHQGRRVLPVYVLSLQQPSEALLIDGSGLYAASKEAVVVLQHGDVVAAPFFSARERLFVSATAPTSSVIAGVVTALASVAPPSQRYSQKHGAVQTDFLWAHGYSPYAPFASSSQLSQVLIDHAVRNAVLWRVHAAVEAGHATLAALDAFAARFLYDTLGDQVEAVGLPSRVDAFFQGKTGGLLGAKNAPTAEATPQFKAAAATLHGLHKSLLEVQEDFGLVAEMLYRSHLRDALFKSEVCLNKATELHRRARSKIEDAESVLACCAVQHSIIPRFEWVHPVRAILFGIIASSLVVLAIFRDPQRRRRAVLHASAAAKRWS